MEHKNRERNSPRVRHAWQTPSLRNHRTEHRAESRTAMSTINRADQRSDRLHAGWRLGSDGLRLPWLDRHFCTKRAALLLLATFGMQGATSVWNAPFAATSGLLNPPGRPAPRRSIAPLRSPACSGSFVFVFQPALRLLPNLGSFWSSGVVCTTAPISNTQSQDCTACTIPGFCAILGLWHPLGTL